MEEVVMLLENKGRFGKLGIAYVRIVTGINSF